MTRALRILIFASALAVPLLLAEHALAKQIHYIGIHPIVPDAGGGFCYIEVPHVHVHAPAKAEVLYRVHDGGYTFVADPVPFGYEGPRHAYYGHHPVRVDLIVDDDHGDPDVEYCYLEGPHYHYYEPSTHGKFTMKGNVYWYVGDYGPEYARERTRLARVNLVYKPLKYERPVVVVAPPPEYHGPVVEVAVASPPPPARAPVVAAGVGVSAGVEVRIPTPSLHVEVGVPGVVVVGNDRVVHHHHVHEVKVKERDHRHKRKHGRGHGRGHWDD
ncbi:MAG: hypothetical protein HY698_21175 [Deltaproteobacteria bacterium]|nr:hypothetical protein [Deltaproteobacteria bacterium]